MTFQILNEQGKDIRGCVKINVPWVDWDGTVGHAHLSLSTIMGKPEMRVFLAVGQHGVRDVTDRLFPNYSDSGVQPSADNIALATTRIATRAAILRDELVRRGVARAVCALPRPPQSEVLKPVTPLPLQS